jgi:hypothetical protein
MIGVPREPAALDRGPVMDALREIVDAAGGLEYARESLLRTVELAQQEYDQLVILPHPPTWAGVHTPRVYYEFSNAVAWTRTVKDRIEDRLRPSVRADAALWDRLKDIRRNAAGPQLEDARLLAKCGLHKFTPPYANAPATVDNGVLLYPVVDRIVNAEDFRANLMFNLGRHVVSVSEDYLAAVTRLVDGLLQVFYPPPAPPPV